MNTLYLTYDGLTDNLGQSQILPYLIGLSRLNHKITIISFEKSSIDSKKINITKQLLSSENVNWIPLSYTKNPPLFSTLYDLLKLKAAVKKEIRNSPRVVIHCRSYITSIIGLWAKKKYSIKFIFDMRGFWADERVDGGIWNTSNFLHNKIYHYFKKKEREFLSHSDHVVSLTESAKKEILSWNIPFLTSSKITIIPCCVDIPLFSPNAINTKKIEALKKTLQITGNDFVISYLGSLGTWYMLKEMLFFFKQLLHKNPSAKFLFITPDKKEFILNAAHLSGIDSDRIIVTCADRSEVFLYGALSRLSVFFIKPCFSKKASSPTKMGEILAMGIPVITNSDIGDVDELLKNSGVGWVINNFNESEYDRAVNQIEELLKVDKAKIISFANEHFALEKGVAAYHSIYQTIN